MKKLFSLSLLVASMATLAGSLSAATIQIQPLTDAQLSSIAGGLPTLCEIGAAIGTIPGYGWAFVLCAF